MMRPEWIISAIIAGRIPNNTAPDLPGFGLTAQPWSQNQIDWIKHRLNSRGLDAISDLIGYLELKRIKLAHGE